MTINFVLRTLGTDHFVNSRQLWLLIIGYLHYMLVLWEKIFVRVIIWALFDTIYDVSANYLC